MSEIFHFPSTIFGLENFVIIENLRDLPAFIDVAKVLNISTLVLEGVTINERSKLIEKYSPFNLIQLSDVIEEDPTYKHVILTKDWGRVKRAFSNHFNNGKLLLASRLTLSESKIERVKRLLARNRNKYEIISIRSDNEKLLKWAAHDRRIDYITVDLNISTKIIDKGLCSLMKQYNKQFEIVLSPLIKATSDRELSELIRNGRKLIELLKIHRNEFILTMGVKNPYEFRTRAQLRYIARIIGLNYNSTKNASYHFQFSNLVKNHIKLSSSYIFEGVVEENGNS
ncbi:MAG: hypothetical protein DRJ35_07890 [Thermoprotei archaeon]|nr:MAG: hypothetical protein DRJ35_07890 [Thermoprotei archaeon]